MLNTSQEAEATEQHHVHVERRWVLFEVLLEMVVVAILVLDVAGVGRGGVGDEEEVEHDEGHVQNQQGPRELGLGRDNL